MMLRQGTLKDFRRIYAVLDDTKIIVEQGFDSPSYGIRNDISHIEPVYIVRLQWLKIYRTLDYEEVLRERMWTLNNPTT